jgi:hypothetical protein
MSPLQIEILLHYNCRADDYRNGDHSAPAVKMSLEWFVAENLLCPIVQKLPCAQPNIRAPQYKLTSRGQAFVNFIQTIPLPTETWEFDMTGSRTDG